MKRFIEFTVAIKSQAAMLFSGAVMLYVVMGFFFEKEAIPSILILQMAALSIICAAWQLFCFDVERLKEFTFALRAMLFLIPTFVVLSVFAYFGKWFPMSVHSWLIFTGVFIVIAPIVLGIYETYYRITGVRYNQMLTAYKNRHREEFF